MSIEFEKLYDERPPRRNVRHHWLKVFVYDLKNEQLERDLKCDFAEKNKEGHFIKTKWLTDLILWATMNNKCVEIVHADDYKTYKEGIKE